jgi:hypothetical protein
MNEIRWSMRKVLRTLAIHILIWIVVITGFILGYLYLARLFDIN